MGVGLLSASAVGVAEGGALAGAAEGSCIKLVGSAVISAGAPTGMGVGPGVGAGPTTVGEGGGGEVG